MARHHIRRCFQFGILDLLLLTAFVAVAVVLSQPVQVKACKGRPWVIGVWLNDSGILALQPDGYYMGSLDFQIAEGFGWTISRHGAVEDAFILTCGKQTYVIRSEWGSRVLDVLSEDGSLQSRTTEVIRWEGPTYDGKPHGTWMVTPPSPGWWKLPSLEYRNGELVDVRTEDGTRDWARLNRVRSIRGLPELSLPRGYDEGQKR